MMTKQKSYEGYPMNVRQATYILTVLSEGSISAAAKKLFITQPALSQTLQNAERGLGAPIFRRGSTPLQLTLAGERYVDAARQTLLIEEKLKNEVDEIKQDEKGRLYLGVSRQRGIYLLPAVLPAFRRRYPQVELRLEEHGSQTLTELTAEGVVDVALASTDTRAQELEYRLVESERLLLLADPKIDLARRYAPNTTLDIAEAKDEAFVLLKRGHAVRGIQNRIFATWESYPQILIETDSFETGMRVAAACGGVMLCPHVYLRDDMLRILGGVAYPLLPTGFERSSYLCWRRGRYLPRYTKYLMALIEESLRQKREDTL